MMSPPGVVAGCGLELFTIRDRGAVNEFMVGGEMDELCIIKIVYTGTG